jgi:hypothetical protein
MSKLRETRGNACEQCGTDSALEWAHVAPTPLQRTPRGRGLPQRVHDITKNPEAYRLLCHIHHCILDGRAF